MPLRVELYTSGGVATGLLPRAERLKDHLETTRTLLVTGTTWLALDGRGSRQAGEMTIETDEVIIAAGGSESHGPVHATWHPIRLEAGPYAIEAEFATMPGFDPGRALTRPSGEFVVLRDVRIALLERPDTGEARHAEALVNRYDVDKVDSDLMLGFFFPGAHVDPPPSVGPPAVQPTAKASSEPVAAAPGAETPAAPAPGS